MFRPLLTYALVFTLFLQSAIAPLAWAAPKPKEESVESVAAELHQKIDEAAANSTDPEVVATAEEAHQEVEQAKREATRQEKRGIFARLKSVSAADWLRYAVTGYKAIYKMMLVWNKTPHNAAGLGAVAIGGAIEVVATAGEFQINDKVQNFPINTKKMPKEKFWRGFLARSVQGSLWLSLAYCTVIPGAINTLSAVAEPGRAYPSLLGSAIGFGVGFATSMIYNVGYLGFEAYKKTGRLRPALMNVFFLTAGLYGFQQGLKSLDGGDAASQLDIMYHMIPVWGILGGFGVGGILKARQEKNANGCADMAQKLGS